MTIHITLTNVIAKALYGAQMIVSGDDCLSGERFVSTRNIASRDSYPIDTSVGDLFVDKKTGLTLFVERFVDPVIYRENGVTTEKLECVLFGISVLSDAATLGKGIVYEDTIKNFVSSPSSAHEIEAADALFEHIKSYYEASEYGEFTDMTGRTVSCSKFKRSGEEFLKRAFVY